MSDEPNIGAAILGLYAAIKICGEYGVDWRKVGELVEPVVNENENDVYRIRAKTRHMPTG